MKTKWREIIAIIIALLLISLVITSFSAWDITKPSDSDAVYTWPASIRDNWDALEVVMGTDLVDATTAGYENVKSPTYGALGNGTTDDATALQAAFDSGGSVIIPEGTYITNTPLTWTTGNATLMFVSHNSIIKAGPTFPVNTPLLHFDGGTEGVGLQNCSIYNLTLYCESRATGLLLTDCGMMRFYSPNINSGRNGDDSYAFDIIGTYGHSGTIWVYGMHIYGSGESGGIRLDGDGYNILDCGFQNIKIQWVRHGIYLKANALACRFSGLMIDCTSTDAGTFGIKEEAGAGNSQNVFENVHMENTSANGTGIDMQATTSYSTMWNYWVDAFATKAVFDDFISVKDVYWIDGVSVRSRQRRFILNGAFDGYSPDSTMTWDSTKSASVANDSAWDKWDFVLPLPNRSIINAVQIRTSTDDGNADLRIQVWKQSSGTDNAWVQVGADQDFTGTGLHVATIDYEIEQNFVVKISILVKRAAGSYLYIYPLSVNADY